MNELDQAQRDLSKRRAGTGAVLVIWCLLAAWHIITPIVIDCDGSRSWLDWSTMPLALSLIVVVFGALTAIWKAMNGDPQLIGDLLNPMLYRDGIGIVYRMAPRMTTIAVLVLLAVLYDTFFRYRLTVHAGAHETLVHDMVLRTFRTYGWEECDLSGPD